MAVCHFQTLAPLSPSVTSSHISVYQMPCQDMPKSAEVSQRQGVSSVGLAFNTVVHG